MSIVRIVAAPIAAVALLFFAATAFAVDAKPTTQWAGYAVTGAKPFTSASGTWRQPRATCRLGAASAAFWVGLGGFSSESNRIEQIGAAADCTSKNRPSYYTWYDLPPNPGVILALKVNAGDLITASVRMNGARTRVALRIADATTGGSYSTVLAVTSPDLTSAEWITEAPLDCNGYGSCQSVALANFGSVAFTRIAAVSGGHAGTITDAHWANTAIKLVPHTRANSYFPGSSGALPSDSTAGAVPSGLTSAGDSFGVSWKAKTTASTSTPTSPTSPNAYVAGVRR